MKDGGYDKQAIEAAAAVASKTSEVGLKAWGVVKAFAFAATQQVESFAKDPNNSFQDSTNNGYSNPLDNGYIQQKGNSSGRGLDDEWDSWNQSEKTSQSSYNDSIRQNSGSFRSTQNQRPAENWDSWENDSAAQKNSAPDRRSAAPQNTKKTESQKSSNWAGWDGFDDGQEEPKGKSQNSGKQTSWDDWD